MTSTPKSTAVVMVGQSGSRYCDAVVRLLTSNAQSGTRESVDSLIGPREQLLADVDDPVVVLARNIGCADDEIETLALCVYVERSLERQRALASLTPDGIGSIRLGLLDQLVSTAHRGSLTVGADSRLRRSRLVNVTASGPFASRQVAVDSTLLWALCGDPRPDPGLPPGSRLIDRGGQRGEEVSLLVIGNDLTRRRSAMLAELAGGSVLVVPSPADEGQWDAAVREATLTNAALVIELTETIGPVGTRVLDEADHLVVGLSSPVGMDPEQLPRRVWREIRSAAAMTTAAEVIELLGQDSPYPLTADQLRRVHATMPLVGGNVVLAVQRLADHRLFKLGSRVTPSRTWDDLVVDDDCMAELQHLTDRYRLAGRVRESPRLGRFVSPGVLAVFAGPSGTGKTLAAEVIAHDLGLELVKIDLSTVVSKYIGETEKNLEEIFEAASVGGSLVLFDEGDALFGKRSAVSDARDRYANIEVAYLLQRVETFEGFVIISTNLAGNVDQAFQRRLQAMIEFPVPDGAAREQLWRLHLPEGLYAGDVDIDELATIALSGGNIRNIAVSAAFLAARADAQIDRSHLRLALQREMRKLGRLADNHLA